MTNTAKTIARSTQFAKDFDAAELPILPKMHTVILACADARVDPAHVLGLSLGEVVVIRNNGARVTPSVLEEIATLAFLVAKLDGDTPRAFEVILMQHTQCGAGRFADPSFQNALKAKLGIDVSSIAITDHDQSLTEDIERLRTSSEIPNHITVSGFIYDVETGAVREVAPPIPLG
jgi:carbonic anhydrase